VSAVAKPAARVVRKPARKPGRGALAIVAIILASSGALRLGTGIGRALAEAPGAAEATTPKDCPIPPAALAAALTEREQKVRTEEAAVAQRLAALALADQAITKRLGELKGAEDEMKKTLSIADGAAENDLAKLTSVYEAMKPADAAALFNKMDPDFASGFLGRMHPEAAAAILSGMNPDTAYSISVLVAGRNANAPKN
jgi:flagellar motility protein MotE (MotC chaperone)